ncbi:hypothetical protein HK097_004340 [Rhizophlyctis rosea]|uniref:HAD-like protein n=1 Tax=Rhizophlyctis rosea TaxID=64517 RepID=A0AAD5X8F2_9FUNG|nr:hypothetical protein HK097_004340 [Rhizophlyctis rosea]
MYKAVIFDVGGVCVHSPLEGIRAYEKRLNLPTDYLNLAIQSRAPNGAFQRLERGEISLIEFYPLFSEEMSDPANKDVYRRYAAARGFDAQPIPDVTIDGKDLFRQMVEAAQRLDDVVVNAIRTLRATTSLTIAALTNNFQSSPASSTSSSSPTLSLDPPPQLKNLFHHFIESSLVGLRKPDPAFFLHACKVCNVKPQDCVMLDDIPENVKAARAVGMTAIS